MKSNGQLYLIAVLAIIFAVFLSPTDAYAGWPLGQPAHSHLPADSRGYTVWPTYSTMPRAYPYGNFGARGYMPSVVHYDYYGYLSTWGPWPGH